MSEIGITYESQASDQERRYVIDATPSLLTSVTVLSAVATHTQFCSGAAVPVTTTVATPLVYVNVPAGLPVCAENIIKIVITTSDALLSPVHLLVIKTIV